MTLAKVSRRQFMQAGGIGLLGALVSRTNAWSKQDAKLTLYVGTYTSGPSAKSEGIYGYEMDGATGALTRFTSINAPARTDRHRSRPAR